MKNKYLLLGFSLILFSCKTDDNVAVKDENVWDFPTIDNTNEMGVGTTLSTPTSTNVQLDSMKIYYYQDYKSFSNNLPGMVNKIETKETPIPPFFYEMKHYFTYDKNGFVDKSTMVYSDFYNQAKFKFVLDFDYNLDDELNNIKLDFYRNSELVISQI